MPAMRPSPTSPLSTHRLARLTAWARLWLAWFVGVFLAHFGPDPSQRQARRQLDHAAIMVGQMIFLLAAARVRLPRRQNHRHGRLKQAGLMRALIGASLRRALKGKDALSRLAAILVIMRDAGWHSAKLARRLARGLCRLRVIAPAPERAQLLAAAPCAHAAFADTS